MKDYLGPPAAAPTDAFERALTKVEDAAVLDQPAGPLRRLIRGLPLGPWRDRLHGTWLGHPVHPVLVQIPIGMWSSAAVLDCLPHRRRASALLVTLGLAGAAPAALAGWVDWAELHQRQARTGVVHAAANSAAVGLYSLSLWKRLRGRPNAGRALAFAGLGAATLGGAIGGHLSYRQAAGVNHTEAVPYLLDSGWQRIGAAADFPAGELRRVLLGEVPLLVVRQQGVGLRVLADRCSHLSGPLSEGSLDGDCVRCPWHGSTFRLDDGSVATGPATAPQPVFEVREEDGGVLVRPPKKD